MNEIEFYRNNKDIIADYKQQKRYGMTELSYKEWFENWLKDNKLERTK